KLKHPLMSMILLGFFKFDMLANYRIVLFNSDPVRGVTLVFYSVIAKVAFAAFKFNFFTFCGHYSRSILTIQRQIIVKTAIICKSFRKKNPLRGDLALRGCEK